MINIEELYNISPDYKKHKSTERQTQSELFIIGQQGVM